VNGAWLDWGYLIGSLIQLLLVVFVVCICCIMVNSAIATMRSRWRK
jgi:large-conductance mechanosensitive channel